MPVLLVLVAGVSSASVPYLDKARIINGEPANDGEIPHQLHLRYNGGFTCGASLIHSGWTITAAHCVRYPNRPNRYSLAVSASQVNNLISVSEIIRGNACRQGIEPFL